MKSEAGRIDHRPCARARSGTRLAGPIAYGVLVVVVLLVAACMPSLGEHPVSAPSATTLVRVEADDTLWDIAAAHRLPGHTTQQTVAEISELNGLGSRALVAGTTVRVPSVPEPGPAFAEGPTADAGIQ